MRADEWANSKYGKKGKKKVGLLKGIKGQGGNYGEEIWTAERKGVKFKLWALGSCERP